MEYVMKNARYPAPGRRLDAAVTMNQADADLAGLLAGVQEQLSLLNHRAASMDVVLARMAQEQSVSAAVAVSDQRCAAWIEDIERRLASATTPTPPKRHDAPLDSPEPHLDRMTWNYCLIVAVITAGVIGGIVSVVAKAALRLMGIVL